MTKISIDAFQWICSLMSITRDVTYNNIKKHFPKYTQMHVYLNISVRRFHEEQGYTNLL